MRGTKDQQRVEAETRASADLLDHLDDAVIQIDEKGRVLYLNKAAERLLNKAGDELRPEEIWSEYARLFGLSIESACRQVMADYKPHCLELQHRTAASWFELRISPSHTGLTLQMRDITLQKRVELARIDREKWYSTLVNTVGGIVWVADAETFHFSFVSKQAEKVLGYPAERWIHEPTFWSDHLHPDDAKWCTEFCAEASRERRDHEFEYRMIAADGRVVWLRDIVTVTVEDDGVTRLRGIMVDVTAQKEMEKRLHQKEEHFRRLIENAWDCIVVVAEDGTIQYTSPAISRLLGYQPEEVVGTRADTWIAPEDVERCLNLLQKVFTKGMAGIPIEFRSRHKDGSVRIFEATGKPYMDEQGNPVAVINARDITERRKAMEARRASDERYRSLVLASAQVIWVTDPNGNPIQGQPSWCALTGQNEEELKGQGWLSAVHPDDREGAQRIWKEAVEKKSYYSVEFRIRATGKGYRDFAVRGAPVLDLDGSIREWVGTCADITEQKRAAAYIRKWKNRYEAAVESSGQLLAEWTPATNEVAYRGNLEGILGYTIPEMSGGAEKWLALVHPDDREEMQRRLSYALQTYGTFLFEYRIRHKDGTFRFVTGSGQAYHDTEENVDRLLGLVSDITEQRNTLLQLAKAKETAEEASCAKDEFLAALSHELRTPLNPVLMLTSELENSAEISPSIRADFAMIRKNVELEARMIDDLLDITRITRGKLHLNLRTLEAHTVLRQAVEIVRNETEAKQQSVVLDLSAADDRIQADPVRLQQVFWNVLRNAVKFTRSGGKITIRSGNTPGRKLLVEFCDTGSGIAREDMEHIFEPFLQGKTDGGHQFGGLGLGLAISKQVVELHNGRIWAESVGTGEGSTFFIELPLAVAAVAEKKAQPPQVAMPPPGATGSRILLVEDHEPTRLTLARLLTRRGYRVSCADSVAAARDLAAHDQFDLVTSDIGLPDGSGHELMTELHRDYHLTGIALSGYGMEEDIQRSLASGFAAHLTKPVDMESLLHAITDLEEHPVA